jgi:hypothetical protein
MRLAAILTQLGLTNKLKKIGGLVVRGWFKV